MMFVQQMLIPRDVWELAATVPLPKISKTTSGPTSKTSSPTPRISSPTSPSKTLATVSTEPSSLLQQSSALLHKTLPPGQPVSEETTVEDWIAAAPWVQVCFEFCDLSRPNQVWFESFGQWSIKFFFRPSLIHPGCRRQEVVGDLQFYFKSFDLIVASADGIWSSN